MEDKHIVQPLLATTASSSSSFSGDVDANDADNTKLIPSDTRIIFRLLTIFMIGVISIWANHEASKGFEVSIINEAKDSPAGKRFQLFYVSNDKATRILLNASAFAESILYPDIGQTKKQVRRVSLQFVSAENMTQISTVEARESDEFVINMSSSIMGDTKVNLAIISALQRGMARIWLWDGQSTAPPPLIHGLVEYINMLAGFGEVKVFVGSQSSGELISHFCWDDKDPRVVARFLDFCEEHNKGFIQRLNQALRNRWDNRTVGIEAMYLCDSYKKLVL